MLYFHLGSPTHRHSGPDFPIRNELSDHAIYWHSLVGLIVIISPCRFKLSILVIVEVGGLSRKDDRGQSPRHNSFRTHISRC